MPFGVDRMSSAEQWAELTKGKELNPKPGGLPAAAEAAGEEARGPLS